MNKKNLKQNPISKLSRTIILVGDFLLFILLSFNLYQLININIKTQAILSSNILSNNPEEFLVKIADSGVSFGMWFINIGSILVTITFIILLFIPKFQIKKIGIANTVWLGTWLLYIILSLIVVTVVAMSLLSFT